MRPKTNALPCCASCCFMPQSSLASGRCWHGPPLSDCPAFDRLAEPEAGHGKAAEEIVLVKLDAAWICSGSSGDDMQGQQVLGPRMRLPGRRPIHPPLERDRTLIAIDPGKSVAQPAVEGMRRRLSLHPEIAQIVIRQSRAQYEHALLA